MATFTFNTWADTGLPQLNPFVWATGGHELAQYVAADVAQQLLHKPASQRALLIVPALEDLASQDRLDLLANGRNVARYTQWFTAFFQQLAARKCKPTFIGLDEEWNISTFDLLFHLNTDAERIAVMHTYYDNPKVRAKMPATVAQYTPEQYSLPGWSQPEASPAHVAWNAWVMAWRDRLCRQVIYEPARRAWPGFSSFGNYNVIKPSFDVRDFNGWPFVRFSLTGTSCPVLYLWSGKYYQNRAKSEYWNMLINSLNWVRSTVLAGRPVVPWVSHASYDGTAINNPRMVWLWEMLIRHSAASGVMQYILWNPIPAATAEDNALAAELTNEIRHAPPAPVGADELTPLPFDADEITTGNITTTYDEFVQNFLNA